MRETKASLTKTILELRGELERQRDALEAAKELLETTRKNAIRDHYRLNNLYYAVMHFFYPSEQRSRVRDPQTMQGAALVDIGRELTKTQQALGLKEGDE